MSENQHELGEHAPMAPPKKVVATQVPPQTTWYPKEHGDKAEEAWYQQERKPPTPEETANYEREYVYGSHLQPGLERSPTYLTPREREVQEGKGQQLYERSLEERSGIAVRAEERKIATEQYQERLNQIPARGVQGPVSFGALAEQSWQIAVKSDVQLRGLVELRNKLAIQAYNLRTTRSLGEQLAMFEVPSMPQIVGLGGKPVHPLAFVGGFVGGVQSTVMGFAGLSIRGYEWATGKQTGLKVPYAPTLTGGLVSSGVESFSAWKLTGSEELGQVGKLPAEYAVGTLASDVMFSWLFGEAVAPIGKAFKGSRAEGWLIKHSDWYAKRATKGMAPEIVSTPSMTIQQPISMAKLKAGEKLGEYSSYFWGETPIPKAAEVWLAKAPSASSSLKTWVAETWIKRITGGTAFALIQEEIGQTVKPGLPFIPEAQLFKGSSFLPSITGASVLLGLGLMPRTATVSKPMLVSLPKLSQISRPKIEALPTLKLGNIVGNVPTSVTKAFSVVSAGTKLASVQASVQEAKQVQSQTQIQKQMQKQVQSLASQFKTPSLQKQATTFHLPTEASLKRKGKKRAGKKQAQGLYWWEFPILDPEKVWKLK